MSRGRELEKIVARSDEADDLKEAVRLIEQALPLLYKKTIHTVC
jgi:hypothetical protein